jgi:sec-independent protein translocase protein TatA
MGLFRGGVGGPELILILFIVLLLFGSTRLPKLAGSMGKAIKEFRKTASTALDDPAPKTPTARRPRAKTPPKA